MEKGEPTTLLYIAEEGNCAQIQSLLIIITGFAVFT